MTVRIAVARAAEPLVVPTKPSSLGTHGANLQHGRRGAPARDRCPSRALADQHGAVPATRGIDPTALAAQSAPATN